MFYVPAQGEVLRSQPPKEVFRLLPSVIDTVRQITAGAAYMQMYNHMQRELCDVLHVVRDSNSVFRDIERMIKDATGNHYGMVNFRFGQFGGSDHVDFVAPDVLTPHIDRTRVALEDGTEQIIPTSAFVMAVGVPTMWADCDFTFDRHEGVFSLLKLRDEVPMEEGVLYEFGPLSAHFQPEAPAVSEMRYAWQQHPQLDGDDLFKAIDLVE